jgi:putative DNA primase/helicase
MRLEGHIWRPDEDLRTVELVRGLCRRMSARAKRSGFKGARRIAGRGTMKAVEELARSDRLLAATTEQWDQDRFLLNTPGGVFCLKAGQWGLRPQRPDDYLTKSTAVAPAPSGTPCPLWEKFLDRATGSDVELKRFLQRSAGYLLCGDTADHALFFLYGTGANGKSVFLNVLIQILGDYATTTGTRNLMSSSGDQHPTWLADLRGARLVAASETEDGGRWNTALVKQLTGGDPVKARYMRQDYFQFWPQFKLLLCGNHRPELSAVDEAIRRRFHLIPFTQTIPPEERDAALTDSLVAGEGPAILAWAIDGFEEYLGQRLNAPETVRTATAEYLADEDNVGLWLADRVEVTNIDSHQETSTNLFNSFSEWARAAGESPGKCKGFVEKLKGRGFRKYHDRYGRGFCGIKLRPVAPGW